MAETLEAGADRPTADPTPTVRAPADREDCGCLDCLGVEVATLRRGFLATLVWASGLCRAYPAVVLAALTLAGAGVLLETVGPEYLPGPLVGPLGFVAGVAVAVGLRAVVASIAVHELTGGTGERPSRARGGPLAAVRARLVPLAVLVGLLWGLLVAAFLVPGVVSMALFAGLALAGVDPMAVLGFEVVAAVSLVVLLGPFLVVLFKTWFAIEACVVGGYDPVASLRVSWRLATSHRGRLLSILAGTLGTSGVAAAVDPLVGVGGPLPAPDPAVTAAVGAVGRASVVVWFGVYAHLYVQGVLAD